MRHTLRRSCAACARSKHSCDLGTPRCSRCVKRKVSCVYANEPLSAPVPSDNSGASGPLAVGCRFAAVDPFDSYPPTRLPRDHVQRLIHSFLHKIAFQYYPLDLNPTTNPFLVTWWPIALSDPALFHVSLQTACLDEELLAQKGFHTSELLMADSVALLRRKVEDTSLAVQDGTMNSVITLATIEFGKGNIELAQMHVDGVKKMVDMRGGIRAVRQTSPLTARMVSWVSMLIMGHPQFDTQDDTGKGHGIPPIPEWQLDPIASFDHVQVSDLSSFVVDSDVRNVFTRLRSVFQRAGRVPFPTTRLHDLTCYVIHRLLLTAPDATSLQSSPLTECVRYATVLYMFIIQGPTYFSHAFIFNQVLDKLVKCLQMLKPPASDSPSLGIWLLAVGMVASSGTPYHQWFTERAVTMAAYLNLSTWDDVAAHIKSVLWLETQQGEQLFRPHWDAVFSGQLEPPDLPLAIYASTRSRSVGFI